ncbi:MAG: tyrosinase [Planctomycetaceae bacterium]|nr:tyrosinase [Planctomycetaceae bacterium]
MAVTRANYRSLSATQRKTYVDALLKLKKDGNPATGRNYDTYVNWHYQMMQLPMSQMRAHMSPMFLPWHREYLRLLELDLQAVSGDSTLAIPYWNWADPTAGASESLWGDDFMGGNGRTSDFKVMTGPFAVDKGNWPIVYDDTGMLYLSRAFGSSAAAPGLPSQADVDSALALNTYDVDPWDMSADISVSFRNSLEGWGGSDPRLHNQVHVWVGGDYATMAMGASPNDPVFFLHHSNIDRLWAQWQDVSASHTYLPVDEQPSRPGVSLHSTMPLFPATVTTADVLDYRALGYIYDTSTPSPALHAPVSRQLFQRDFRQDFRFVPFRGLVQVPSFSRDIRPLFTDEDLKQMAFAFDLSNYADVKANSEAIVNRIKRDKGDPMLMPPAPRGPWTTVQVRLFQDWISGGFRP